MREKLRYQSIRDPLTGLFNRRYLDESLERELPNAVRKNRSLGIIMLDVDRFKTFNDMFGHDAGDTVLRELGDYLAKFIRRGDLACRYGGEEFTLILPESSLKDTCRRAEELRIAFRQLSIKHRDIVLGKVTLSLGVAALPDHGTTSVELLAAADGALLRAKEEGRDRVLRSDVAASRTWFKTITSGCRDALTKVSRRPRAHHKLACRSPEIDEQLQLVPLFQGMSCHRKTKSSETLGGGLPAKLFYRKTCMSTHQFCRQTREHLESVCASLFVALKLKWPISKVRFASVG